MIMRRRLCLQVVACTAVSSVVFGAGGTIRPATTGLLNYLYALNLPSGTNDRAITRYGIPGVGAPNGSEFDPNSIICGARVRAGHQSNVSVDRPERCDVRLEDPLRPGFPNVAADAPIGGTIVGAAGVGADSNAAPSQCSQFVSYHNFTFGGGLGVRDPRQAVFLTWIFAGAGSINPCWLGLETSAPYNGRGLYYNSLTSTYGPVGANHWLEANVFKPRSLTVHLQMHGSPQRLGDAGQPIWFLRGDSERTITDDYISASIVIDNDSGAIIANQHLSLLVDLSAVRPDLGLKNVASVFRIVAHPRLSLASGNPYTYPTGRTHLEASIPISMPPRFAALLPLQVPFILRSGPITNPGAFQKLDVLGMRAYRGAVDSGTASVAYIAQATTVTNDALATRFPLDRLFPKVGVNPRDTWGTGTPVQQIRVTAIEVEAATNGGAGGFDAVQLRRADPVIANAADQSPQGLLGGAGQPGDHVVDVPVPVSPNGYICHPVRLVQSPRITVSHGEDVWILSYPFPGDTTAGGTFVCADLQSSTYLGQSFFCVAGAQPYTRSDTANFMQRLLFTAVPFTESGEELPPPPDRPTGILPVRAGDSTPRRVLSQREPGS
jgi:hypothetical protein